jgi:hypothetical protein
MWSRHFLIAGLLSGAVAAGIALAAIWLVIFAAHGGGDPAWTPANSVQAGALGIVVYPLAWYYLIYHKQDYSLRRTWHLVIATYAAVSSLAILVIFVGMLYPALQLAWIAVSQPRLESLWMIAGAFLAPFIAAFLSLIVAGFIGIAYVAIAAPIAFLHRLALLRLFAGQGSAANTQVSKS